MSTDPFKIFLDVMMGLPRGGPGSPDNTRAVLAAMPDLPPQPEIADLACGFGIATRELLRETDGRVTAVDMLKPLLSRLEEDAQKDGIPETRLRTVCADMMEAGLPRNAYDLVWCESAVYAVGFTQALDFFRTLLKPGAYAVVSDVVWLTADAPDEARDFWRDAYPEMSDIDARIAQAAEAGFVPVTYFVLPKEEWESEYYVPMRARLADAFKRYADEPQEAHAPLHDLTREIEIWNKYGGTYGSVTLVLRKPA